MSADLHRLLHEAARDEEAAALREFPCTPETTRRYHRDVRRRRTAGGTALAAGVLGVAVVAVLGVGRPWQGAPPVVTPEPTLDSPAPTPSPTPSPTVLGTVTEHPNLPEARPLEAGLLAAATPGWTLVRYDATTGVGGEDPAVAAELVPGPQIVYLLAPDGALYEAADLAAFGDDKTRVLDWAPGSSLVLLDVYPQGGAPEVLVADFETGTVVAEIPLGGAWPERARFTPSGDVVVATTDGPEAPARLERFDVSGRSLGTVVAALPESWVETPRGWLVTPGDDAVVVGGEGIFAVVGWDGSIVTDLPVPDGVLGCRPGRWWPDGRLLAVCTDDLGAGEAGGRRVSENVWLVDVGGDSAPERLTHVVAPDLQYDGIIDAWDIGGQRYAQWTGDCGAVALGRIDGGSFEPLVEGGYALAPRETGFLVERRVCGDPYADLVSVDLDGGVQVLVPRVGDAYGVLEVLPR